MGRYDPAWPVSMQWRIVKAMFRKDPFELDRFVEAQAPRYESVVRELGNGLKTSHWMWYVFPQVAGLGYSSKSEHYAIKSLFEAQAYLDHSVLGRRLAECTELVLALNDRTAIEVFGHTDSMKFRSSMTLFSQAANDIHWFDSAIEKFYGGAGDDRTSQILDSLSQK